MYLKLMEECAEVQQRVSKLLQFGPQESEATNPFATPTSNPTTNLQRLQDEVYDLVAVIELLGLELPGVTRISEKAARIEKYRRYSEELGLVTA
jgi:hypothetical protein